MIVTDLSNSFHPCPKPLQKTQQKKQKSVEKTAEKNKTEKVRQKEQDSNRKSGQMKKKSKKLAKLENSRFSILTINMKKCYLCQKAKKHIHEIYKGSNRQTSMKNGFCIPVCVEHHLETENNSKLDKRLKEECQRKYEEKHTRADFIKLIGKSYLED